MGGHIVFNVDPMHQHLFSPWFLRYFNDLSDQTISLIFPPSLMILLSTPMGVDYVVIGFDMEVQPLVTHNAA